MRRSIILLAPALLLASIFVNPSVDAQQRRMRVRRTRVITLERGPCFGACPVYKLTIFSDGKVTYEGIRFVKKLGRASGRISRAQLDDLVQGFLDIYYFNLPGSYTPDTKQCPQHATDMPSAITSLNWRGRYKSVNHYHGCTGLTVLENLTRLEDEIDAVVKTDRWIK